MQPFIIEEMESNLLLFTINRPEKRNAINYDVMDGLEKVIRMAREPLIKGVVITGAGDKAFCSGGDLSAFHNLRTEQEAYGMLSKMSKILYDLLMLPKPTFALLNGTAIGGGCELATSCDFRIARKGIKVGFVQAKLSITTGWGGGTILFEKLNQSEAFKLLLEAEVFQCDEIEKSGFIHSTFDNNITEGFRYITSLLKNDAEVIKAYKEIFIRKWKETKIDIRMEEEVKKCAILWANELHHQKVDEFLKKLPLKK